MIRFALSIFIIFISFNADASDHTNFNRVNASDYTNLDSISSRVKALIYTPNGWSLTAYEKPSVIVGDPDLRTYATFNTNNSNIRGEIRLLKKGQYDAATVLSDVAEQTIDAKLQGADIIAGNQDIGVFRMLYADKQGSQYIEQVVSVDDIAVTIIFSLAKDSTLEEKKLASSVLDKSSITVDRK
ncbi:hypothetical protein [Rhizobium sp. KDH_Rht_773_N]